MRIPDISKMSLAEKIGQMFLMRDDRLHDMVQNDKIAEYLKRHPIGGIWATGRLKEPAAYLNFESGAGAGTLDDLREYIELLNSNLEIPLLVGGDSEKGGFMGATEICGPDAVVAADDDELTYKYAACEATELRYGGLNWRWSPIADIAHHDNAVCINRVCSDDPDRVISYVNAFVKGTQDAGVAATVKHFPGLDLYDTRDPHFMTPALSCDFDEWMSAQGKVFKNAVSSGVYSMMISHHAFPAVDDSRIGKKRRPATFSKKLITDLLKNEWGFDGVVITDDLGMRAAFSVFGRENMGDMYVELINAGNDMLLGTPIGENFEDYIGAVEAAVKDGRIDEARIDDACRRILSMKAKLGLFDDEKKELPSFDEAGKATQEMNRMIAEKSLTLISNESGLLPVEKPIKSVSIIPVTHFSEFGEKLIPLKEAFEKRGIEANVYENIYGCNLSVAAQRDDLIIYANFVSAHHPMGRCTFFGEVAQQFFKIMTFGADKSIAVSFGSPFIKHEYYEETETFINAYWYNREIMEALVKAILGEIPFEGRSPFEV